jgi:beta-lactamase class A
MHRRTFLLASASLAFATPSLAQESPFAALEQRIGARLGIAAHVLGSNASIAYRADERFPMCSTFKLLAVAAVFRRVDTGEERLDRWVHYGEKDLQVYAPIARANLAQGGMSLGALCSAALQWSDNTAANLVLTALGGPAGATRYIRTLGDPVTRIDRMEPILNTAIADDPRDTTTPQAMLSDLHALAYGHALKEESRSRLVNGLANWRTRLPRLAAGLPPDWRSAHKMGTGDNGTANDVAIFWPPVRPPILVAAYCTGSSRSRAEVDAVLADAARVIVKAFSG